MADPKTQAQASEEQKVQAQAQAEQRAQNEQRARQEAPKKEDVGAAPHIIQNPVERNPNEIATEAQMAAELATRRREDAEAEERAKQLPQSTIDEIEAGKAALKRHSVAAPQAVTNKE